MAAMSKGGAGALGLAMQSSVSRHHESPSSVSCNSPHTGEFSFSIVRKLHSPSVSSEQQPVSENVNSMQDEDATQSFGVACLETGGLGTHIVLSSTLSRQFGCVLYV
jgi:hypothetical protein